MNDLIILLVDDAKHYLAVLAAWEKAGVSKLAIHTLTSFDHAEHSGLYDDTPWIPGLHHFLTDNKRPHHILLAMADSHELVEKMMTSAQEVMVNPEDPSEGALFVVPVLQALRWTK